MVFGLLVLGASIIFSKAGGFVALALKLSNSIAGGLELFLRQNLSSKQEALSCRLDPFQPSAKWYSSKLEAWIYR